MYKFTLKNIKMWAGFSNLDLDSIINVYAGKIMDFFFIEIGACDGVIADPIRKHILKYNWGGILVEPLDFLFERLVHNYRGKTNLIFENAAISNDNAKTKSLYYLKEDFKEAPVIKDAINKGRSDFEGYGSFSKEEILHRYYSKLIPDVKNYIISKEVRCMKISELFEKHKVRKIDLLLIDTEGYDFEIIKGIDFSTIKPKIIFYEENHLCKEDKRGIRKLLLDNGYIMIDAGINVIVLLFAQVPLRIKMQVYFGRLLYRIFKK